MPIERLSSDTTGARVAECLACDGCVIVERLVAPCAARSRPRTSSQPCSRRRPPGRRRVRRPPHPPHRRADRPLADRVASWCMHPLVLDAVRTRRSAHAHQLPAAPHPGHRHRARRARPDDPPRPVGLRLLPVPGRLRGAVQHDLGDDRLHRGERRHAGRSRAATCADDSCELTPRRHRAGRDAGGLGAPLHRLRVPRRRRQHVGRRRASA